MKRMLSFIAVLILWGCQNNDEELPEEDVEEEDIEDIDKEENENWKADTGSA